MRGDTHTLKYFESYSCGRVAAQSSARLRAGHPRCLLGLQCRCSAVTVRSVQGVIGRVELEQGWVGVVRVGAG